ncbi:phosphoglyceromutase [Tepidanaerobacter syntrophicus]|uniref:phosphoglyceromutase n=1 Tax=Tepidanaerobacter syntrophicus TaxID=224999 RepID=UPI001BD333DE|nr:phosphoglyceromutase [Tepidanaerobacter syntrophicus]
MKKGIVIFMILIMFVMIIPHYGYAKPISEKKVIMVILDDTNYEEMVTYGGKNIEYLLKNGALGLMNVNSASSFTSANSYATIGAGAYATSANYAAYAGGYYDLFHNEPINVVYKRNTGNDMNLENIANVGITELNLQNKKLNRIAKPALLGTLLHENGYKTAIIGNEDTDFDDIKINASLITTDENGITDFGVVNQTLLAHDPMSPYGIRSDYDKLYTAFCDIKDKADFIVIQPGDMSRLNKYMDIAEDRYNRIKSEIFSQTDKLIGKLFSQIDDNTLFLLVVPFPSAEDSSAGKRLTPIIALNKNIPSGTLTSATTKRDGIVTNTDIAACILDYFGIPKDASMTGHKLTAKNIENPLGYLEELNRIAIFNYKIRSSVVKTYIGFIIGVLILFLISIKYFEKYLTYVKFLLIGVLITPTMLLLLPLASPWSVTKFVLCLIGSVLLVSLLVFYFLKDNLKIFIATCLPPVPIILIDTFLENPLMRVSILGYDPIVGARFYGIGNEYMGFLIGAAIIGIAAIMDRAGGKQKIVKILSMVFYLVILLTLMAPSLGTNVGGSMAAFIGFGVSVILNTRGKLTKKDFLVLICLLVVSILALFIYDGMRPSSNAQSHIGQTTELIKHNSFFALFQIFARKLSMNYKLIRYSSWVWVLFGTVATLCILFARPVGILKEIFRKHVYLYFGFIAGIIATLAALAFNDSGVVAAATMMIPLTIPLIMMCIDEIENNKQMTKNGTEV